MTDQKANRAEIMQMVSDTITIATADPADEIIAVGEALVKIGQVLKGVSTRDAKAIVKSVMIIHDIEIR